MFDIGFSELLVIGVVALVVIGPERLPKVARTAGHLYGRLQRYVSTVKSDISREVELDELKRAGQEFRTSVEAAASDVQQQGTVVDDYLKNELAEVDKVVTAMATTEGDRPVTTDAFADADTSFRPQQSLPLDEPDQTPSHQTPSDLTGSDQTGSDQTGSDQTGSNKTSASPHARIEIARPAG